MVFQENMIERELQRSECLLAYGRTELALPNRDAMPSQSSQCLLVGLIPFPVAKNLLGPEICIGFGHPKEPAILMPMPKATIHKDAGAVFSHDNVGMSWQPLMAEPVSESS
jgi:hypothetical protein